MKRINIIGTSGSGKSTVSQKLAAKLDYPYYQMDALFWKPNWGESSDEELFNALTEVVAKPTWVLDGNYSRTQPIKWKSADTIIWIDYSFPRTFYQALKRAVTRIVKGKELWEGTGNTESFRKTFMSRNSILIWTLKGYRKNKCRYKALMASPEYRHIRFIRLRSPKETEAFLSGISPSETQTTTSTP